MITNGVSFYLFLACRKFGDTGNTNSLQLTGGTHSTATWADVVTAHSVAGPAAVQTLEAAIKDPKLQISSVLLVAEMSSEGALTDAEYARKTVEMAKKCSGVVSGFICQKRCADDPQFLYWTPGKRQ